VAASYALVQKVLCQWLAGIDTVLVPGGQVTASDCSNDWSGRYPLVLATMHGLRVRSCLIEGEIVVTRLDGVSCFERLRSRLHDETAFIYAFDLLELDGKDLRREPLAVRKAALVPVVVQAGARLRLNEHIEADGTLVLVTPASSA
jgi:bifunctional non-homologous end joining protein LigD